jgi:hypothetical protein
MDKPFLKENWTQILEKVKEKLRIKHANLTDYGQLFTNERQEDTSGKDQENPGQSKNKW